MKRIVVIVCLIVSIITLSTSAAYFYFEYTGRKYLNHIEEKWPAYIVEDDKTIKTEPIEIIKEKYRVTLTYQSKVCMIEYRGSNAPHKCEEVPNWTIMFDDAFDAVVIEEYNKEKSMVDFFYLGVYDNKPFFNYTDTELISLAKKISTNAEYILGD